MAFLSTANPKIVRTIDLDTLTYTSRALRESTPVSANLEQIAYEIRNIHSAIARFSPGAPSQNAASFDRER